MIIFTRSAGFANGPFGYYETPIKMIIENESNLLKTQNGICNQLFNIESSTHFGETVVGYDEFGIFTHVDEGENPESDLVRERFYKFVEHVQFTKEFAVSAEAMEDANYGMATDIKRRAESFVRAYYKTMNKLCEAALINGAFYSTTFGNARIDTSAPDGYPLFSNSHIYGSNESQSNYYAGDLVCTGEEGNRVYSATQFSESLAKLNILFRNMVDESGEPLGYTPDTIIIPSNRPQLETIVRQTCGSYGMLGTNNNDINLHYGNYTVVVLPGWRPERDEIMLMSSEANKNLNGNMFFNRIPLTVTNWVDNHSGNYIWNGRCRFGVGFGSYKHIMRAVDLVGEDNTGNTSVLE